jgi:hypothetical protein
MADTRVHLQEAQYIACEREAETAELRREEEAEEEALFAPGVRVVEVVEEVPCD